MRNIRTLGLVGFFVFLGGCAPHYTTIDEEVDLYLSTLDDKHFVWCKLDLEQCRQDFEKWKQTPRGRMIIREFEQENTGQTYNTHHLPNVFRTGFVDESQFAEEMVEGPGKGQGLDRDAEEFGRAFPSIVENGDAIQEGRNLAPRIYGPNYAP